MLRLFSLFGRSADMNALDDALRSRGVHPILVPDAVKLTVIRLHKRGGDPILASADLLAYCILGPATFAETHGPADTDAADQRLEAAIAAGDTLDAKLVLLTLHAGLLAPDIADRIEIDAA